MIRSEIAKTVGKPWKLNACGPDAFDCKGLVCYALENWFGLEPPPILKTTSAEVDLCKSDIIGKWRPHTGLPEARDILVCYGSSGPHVGIFVMYNGLTVLHCVQPPGVITGVCCHSLEQLAQGGSFGRFRLWRYNEQD